MDSWYHRLRDQQWEARERQQVGSAAWLRELDALYLFGTLGTEAVLRGNGEVWVRPDDQWDNPAAPEPTWRLADERERTSALVIAGERLPEVRSLLPARPSEATTCGRCSGTGYFIDGVVCPDCGALGWISAPVT